MLLYIDPGTGSMLFTLLIGIIGTLGYAYKSLKLKLKFLSPKSKDAINTGEEKSVPLAIFSDDKRYWTVFEPVCKELSKRSFDFLYLTMSEDDKALSATFPHMKSEYIGKGNKAFSRLNFLNATMVLSTVPGLDVYQWKRSSTVKYYIHLPHMASDITLYRMFGIDFYDAVLLSGEYQKEQVRALERGRALPSKELSIVGIPYFDEMKIRLSSVTAQKETGTKTVLLAPTWGKSSIFAKYGTDIIDELIKTGYNIIIRPHPQSFTSEKKMIDDFMKKYPASEGLEWNRDADNFSVLKKADILISDFSGVIFDFALVYDKPIIYTDTNFDPAPYDQWSLDSPLWTFEILPKIGAKLTKENLPKIRDLIDSALMSKNFAISRDKAREETWEHPGEGAKRTADYIVNKYSQLISSDENK